MEKLSTKIAAYFIEENIIKEDEYEICQYGLFILLNNISVCMVILLAGIIIKMYIETLTYLFVFCSLRSYTGGYHANSVKGCHLLTYLGYFIVMAQINLLSAFVNNRTLWMIICLITYFLCLLIICKYAPVEHINQPLENDQKKRNRKYAVFEMILLGVLGINTYPLTPAISFTIYVSVIEVVTLILCGRRKSYEKNVGKNNGR